MVGTKAGRLLALPSAFGPTALLLRSVAQLRQLSGQLYLCGYAETIDNYLVSEADVNPFFESHRHLCQIEHSIGYYFVVDFRRRAIERQPVITTRR